MTDDARARAARLLARSPLAMPRAAAISHMEERRKQLLTPPPPAAPSREPDFAAPEPLPILDQPQQFAVDFWAKRRPSGPDHEPPKPNSKPKRPKGRRPTELGPRHGRFEVFDGGAGVDKKK
jgi:hypothetical protein